MSRYRTMTDKVEEYLAYRRGLGYQLRAEGGALRQFGAYADGRAHRGPLTVDLAVRWARLPADRGPGAWARRLTVVRCLARYLAISEPGTEIPGVRLLGTANRRPMPHIYSEAEVSALIAAARQAQPADGLRPQTYATLIGLLACTGLRSSEAMRLARSDFDDRQGTLLIRETKFRKSRLIPLHPSTREVLLVYARARDRLVRPLHTDRFFVTDRGYPLRGNEVWGFFRALCDGLCISGRGSGRRPRLHDLRHTFACRRVQMWYEMGADLAHAIAALSVYLGHAKVNYTYWYLTATPELLACAAARFEPFARPGDKEGRP